MEDLYIVEFRETAYRSSNVHCLNEFWFSVTMGDNNPGHMLIVYRPSCQHAPLPLFLKWQENGATLGI